MMSKKHVIFISGLAFIFGMFYFYSISSLFKNEVEELIQNLDEGADDPMAKTMKKIKAIRELCDDLCDTSKKIKPGEFLGTVTAKVDCKALFQSPLFSQPADMPPQPWGQMPQELQDMYSYGGRVGMQEWFWDEKGGGMAMEEARIFTKEIVESYVNAWIDGTPSETYLNASNIVAEAADYIDVANKTILVIGTQTPWVEAILLNKKAKKVVTLEYGYFISEYPGLSFMRPREFRERYLNSTLEKFDAIFTYSSVEHSGQGRFGDPLNPWGDILSIAEAWCVSKKEALLAIAVPTMVSKGQDLNVFNAHKMYGPVMYPFLTTNWKFLWPTNDAARVDPNPEADPSGFQPVFVFEKNKRGFWGIL